MVWPRMELATHKHLLSHTKRSMASILLALSKQNMPALQTAPINLKLVAETGRLRLDP